MPTAREFRAKCEFNWMYTALSIIFDKKGRLAISLYFENKLCPRERDSKRKGNSFVIITFLKSSRTLKKTL